MKTIESVLTVIRSSIDELEAKLSVQVLDGTPFLVCIEDAHGTLVYGTWKPGYGNGYGNGPGNGFRHIDTAPNSLCGVHHFSRESADSAVKKLSAAGEQASVIHWRAALEDRLEALKKLFRDLSAPKLPPNNIVVVTQVFAEGGPTLGDVYGEPVYTVVLPESQCREILKAINHMSRWHPLDIDGVANGAAFQTIKETGVRCE